MVLALRYIVVPMDPPNQRHHKMELMVAGDPALDLSGLSPTATPSSVTSVASTDMLVAIERPEPSALALAPTSPLASPLAGSAAERTSVDVA
jgi:hypothetical protein